MSDSCNAPLPDCVDKLARLAEARADDSAKLDKILKHLEGNGREGLIVRVDRLEQTEKRRSRLVLTVAATVIALVVKTGWELLTTGDAP